MSYYYPFGVGASKDTISFAITAVSASVPQTPTTLMPTAIFATSIQTAPTAGSNGTSKTLVECQGLVGSQGVSGATGNSGSAGTDKGSGMCPPTSKECPGLFVSLSALNATLGPNDQFGVVCMDLEGRAADSLSCPPSLPIGVPTLPEYVG